MSPESFQAAVRRTMSAGLKCAVNMDTGYANYLSGKERREVLSWTREAAEGGAFVGGVFVEGLEGNLVDLYRQGADEVVEYGGIPILFQTTRIHGWGAGEIVDLYAEVCGHYPQVLGFELGRMFAPNGLIFDEETFTGLMEIPTLCGLKHSSLDRGVELRRLALRDEHREDFRIYTGNDLGIDMIEYGSDYLLGLAAFCPELFAERDRLWAEGNEDYFALSDALQYLGNVAFRAEVPAYKHSCAIFQHLIGRCPSERAHPQCPRRPESERIILRDCAERLGFKV